MPQKKHFSQSLENRLYTAEFDDALVDAAHWKNPRYAGCKLTGKKINEYNSSETSSGDYLGKYIDTSTNASGSITFTDTIGHTGIQRNRFIWA